MNGNKPSFTIGLKLTHRRNVTDWSTLTHTRPKKVGNEAIVKVSVNDIVVKSADS